MKEEETREQAIQGIVELLKSNPFSVEFKVKKKPADKIEPKQEWSEEDEMMLECVLDKIGDLGTGEMCKEWLINLKYRVGCEVNCTTTKEWSEEDETTKNNISHIIRQYDKISKRENKPCWYIGDCLLWMQNIKDRVQPQPKQEWSEEDEKHDATYLYNDYDLEKEE